MDSSDVALEANFKSIFDWFFAVSEHVCSRYTDLLGEKKNQAVPCGDILQGTVHTFKSKNSLLKSLKFDINIFNWQYLQLLCISHKTDKTFKTKHTVY